MFYIVLWLGSVGHHGACDYGFCVLGLGSRDTALEEQMSLKETVPFEKRTAESQRILSALAVHT